MPPLIIASGPPGTEWFGGAVDRSKITLRVMSKVRSESVDKRKVAELLGRKLDPEKFKHWSLSAPDSEGADLDSQVDWILLRLNTDLTAWNEVGANNRIDLFCGLFVERANRGFTVASRIMAELDIELGFEIYASEETGQGTAGNDENSASLK